MHRYYMILGVNDVCFKSILQTLHHRAITLTCFYLFYSNTQRTSINSPCILSSLISSGAGSHRVKSRVRAGETESMYLSQPSVPLTASSVTGPLWGMLLLTAVEPETVK